MAQPVKPARILILDVDGVLTDGRVLVGPYAPYHEASRTFHARDRVAIRTLAAAGWRVVLLSASDWSGIHYWAANLPVEIYQDSSKTLAAVWDITQGEAYVAVGDDPTDLPLLLRAERAFVPADADLQMRELGHDDVTVLRTPGGAGLVWEVARHLGVTPASADRSQMVVAPISPRG